MINRPVQLNAQLALDLDAEFGHAVRCTAALQRAGDLGVGRRVKFIIFSYAVVFFRELSSAVARQKKKNKEKKAPPRK